jgi:hypothetical protein
MQFGLLRNPLLSGIDQSQGPSGLKFLPVEKFNAIADCLENPFEPRNVCGENYEQRV